MLTYTAHAGQKGTCGFRGEINDLKVSSLLNLVVSLDQGISIGSKRLWNKLPVEVAE